MVVVFIRIHSACVSVFILRVWLCSVEVSANTNVLRAATFDVYTRRDCFPDSVRNRQTTEIITVHTIVYFARSATHVHDNHTHVVHSCIDLEVIQIEYFELRIIPRAPPTIWQCDLTVRITMRLDAKFDGAGASMLIHAPIVSERRASWLCCYGQWSE